MGEATRETLRGSEGEVSVRVWDVPDPRYLAVLSHGYGEHIDRYGHLAAALTADGAAVYGPDHLGHGRSAGERVEAADVEHVVDHLQRVVELARAAYPGLPVVLVGLLALPEIPDVPIDPAVLSREAAVGTAYASDPLVWHGPYKRPTIEAFGRAFAAIDAGPGFGALPVLYLHGAADQLVPLSLAQPVVRRLAGSDFTEVTPPGARHEISNETNRDEVVGEAVRFAGRVAAAPQRAS